MTSDASRQVQDIRPITFATDAREVALGVHERLLRLLDQLDAADWQARTEGHVWNVADSGRASHRSREGQRVGRGGDPVAGLGDAAQRQFHGNELDAMNALQVRMHASLSSAECA